MGNTTSTNASNNLSFDRDAELSRNLSSISETSYPNFFESKSIGTVAPMNKKRKYSSTSTVSSNSTILPTSPVIKEEVIEEELDEDIEIIGNRKYLKNSTSHRFYLPVDDQESDRLVILVDIINICVIPANFLLTSIVYIYSTF